MVRSQVLKLAMGGFLVLHLFMLAGYGHNQMFEPGSHETSLQPGPAMHGDMAGVIASFPNALASRAGDIRDNPGLLSMAATCLAIFCGVAFLWFLVRRSNRTAAPVTIKSRVTASQIRPLARAPSLTELCISRT
ncbi:MAG: hypothetical protein H0W21_04120 [Actinobacteria bacterium]|nr:hypothetical protein [Actinomycetota bacterium]